MERKRGGWWVRAVGNRCLFWSKQQRLPLGVALIVVGAMPRYRLHTVLVISLFPITKTRHNEIVASFYHRCIPGNYSWATTQCHPETSLGFRSFFFFFFF